MACSLGQSCFSGFCTSSSGNGGGTASGGGGGTPTGGGGGTPTGGGGGTPTGGGGGTPTGGGGGSPTGGGGGTPTGGGGGTPTGGGGGTPTGGGGGPTGGGGPPTGGGGGAAIDCTQQIAPVFGSGGCTLYAVSPANCAQVNFNTLGYVEFAWSTNGTMCEGPHRLFLLGDPPSTWAANNGFQLSLSDTNGNVQALGTNGSTYAMTRNLGGFLHLVRADLNASGVTTVSGQFHWAVMGYYDLNNGGSTSGTRTFTVAP